MEKKLPEGWVWTTLGTIAIWGSGGTPKRNRPDFYGGNIPWIKTGDLNDQVVTDVKEFISELGLKNSSAKLFPKGAIGIAMYGATIGKTGMFGMESACNQACAVALPLREIDPSFLHMYLKSQKKNFIDLGKGGAQPNISQTVLKAYEIALPPLAEQKRMVAKLDALFGHLDALREKLDRIPPLLQNFRQQVLTQAVTGKLTEEWRGKNNLEKWDEIDFERVIKEGPQNGLYKPAKNYGKGTRIIRIDNFYDGIINPPETFKRVQISDKEQKLYLLEEDDILINRVNSMSHLGKSGLVPSQSEPCVFESNMMRIKIDKEQALPSYVINFLRSKIGYFELRKNAKHAVNQASINQKDVKSVLLSLPPIKEQQVIVRRVEGLFSAADALEARYHQLKAKIDALPQAILAKAFKGELVPQNPEDEAAGVLLERIKGERGVKL